LDTALQTLFYQIQKQTQPKQISGWHNSQTVIM
jgi:hypothetical protein